MLSITIFGQEYFKIPKSIFEDWQNNPDCGWDAVKELPYCSGRLPWQAALVLPAILLYIAVFVLLAVKFPKYEKWLMRLMFLIPILFFIWKIATV